MANGYLGKISAIVSANTSDFQSKLNASAKDVQAFARSVQSNLTSASRDAARSFESIYTPLQKFERSLQAAASMKLSFKGFAGAIKDVDVLRQRLGSMKDSQISLVLKASGMKNITEVREALVGLRAKDLQIVAKVGGIEKVRELRALSAEKRVDFAINLIDSGLSRKLADARAKVQELKATVASVRDGGAAPTGGITGLASEYREAAAEYRRLQELGRQTIKTTLGVNVQKDADVDRILQAGERAEAIRLPVVLDVLGEAAVKEAVTQSQRLRSVAEQINKPFGEAVQKISAMSVEIQASFLPAMKRSQSQVESLKSSIEKGVLPASAIAQQFDVVERRVSAAVAAVNRLAEASQKIGSMKTGRELAFANPALAASLDRGVEMGNKAAGLPASAIQANPRIAAILGEYQDRANQAAAAYGRLQAKIAGGLPTGSAERQLDSLRDKMAALEAEFGKIYEDIDAPRRQQADAKMRASAAGQMFLPVLQKESQALSGSGAADLAEYEKRMERQADAKRRAAAAGQLFLTVLQKESQSLSGSGAADLAEYEQRMEQQADAKRRAAAAGQLFLTVLQKESQSLSGSGAADLAEYEQRMERQADAKRRAVAAGQMFLTVLQKESQALSSGAASLADYEQGVLRRQAASNFRGGFGGADASGVNLGLDQRALQGYSAQLQVLQSAIGRASAEARGPAVAAFNQLRNAVATAFDEGNIDSGIARDRLAALRTEAIAAAAAVSRIRVGSLTRDVSRAGDIGRQGFDRFSLALNQAAFAVDDFMSSTGGIEFKLRAISNNITQLAFILGGTTGLFVGLGAVIAGQAAVGLLKWMNNGRTAEDQTKALNESLARQKSLVEDLAQSFKSLGDAMSRGTLSQGGQQAKEIAEQVKDIQRKQRESREGRVFDLDPNIQKERAQQIADRKKLDNETDAGRRIVLARQIQRSEELEQGAKSRLRVQPVPSGMEVSQVIERAASRMEAAGRDQRPSDIGFPAAAAVRAAGAGVDQGGTLEAIRSQIRALESASSQLQGKSRETFLGLQTREAAIANLAIKTFADLSARLSAKLSQAVDEIAVSVAEGSRGPAEQIRQSQEEVAKAIDAGLPFAREFAAELDKLGNGLSEAYRKLGFAVSGKDADGNTLSDGERERLTNEAKREIDSLESRRARVASQTDAFRYERAVDPQRQIEARMGRARSNLSAGGLEDGRIARRMREIENNRETLRQQAELPEFQNPMGRRMLRESEAALNREVAAIEAVTLAIKIFADSLNRASDEVRGNLNSAQQAADAARRKDLSNSTPETVAARRRANADLERQRLLERKAQEEIAVERDSLEQLQRPDQMRLQQINEQLASGGNGNREALIRERSRVIAKMEDDARVSQARIETIRDASTQEEEQRQSRLRGRDLGMTDRERFRKEFTEGAGADINARAKELRDQGVNPQGFLRQALQNQMESVAPMLQQFQEERQNAILQGPSRAALNVSDVSTSQGQTELNRLLRGDDSAKDVNLAELQKQTERLDEVVKAIREGNPGVLL